VPASEIAMLGSHTAVNPLDDLEPVTDAAEVRKVIGAVGAVHVAPAVQEYAVALTSATRTSPDLLLGASPRATLHLVRAAKAYAALQQRDYVVPDDVRSLVQPVLAHRLLPSAESAAGGRAVAAVLEGIAAAVPVPA
jgi:MoxR-like ATPase